MPTKTVDLATVLADLHTLDSKVNLLTQNIRTIEKNEEVLGRTLITLNVRLKKLEEGGSAVKTTAQARGEGPQVDAKELEKKYATKQELSELRYILDAINPLEYATLSQVRDLINEKMGDVKKTVQTIKKEAEKEDSSAGGMFEKI